MKDIVKRKKFQLEIIILKVKDTRPWHYEAILDAFGRKQWLTFGNTIKDAQNCAMRKIKNGLFKGRI